MINDNYGDALMYESGFTLRANVVGWNSLAKNT